MAFLQQAINHSRLNEIIGLPLSAVTFAIGYIQLQFNGRVLSVRTPVTVTVSDSSASSGDTYFRNLLCEQLTKVVESIDYRERKALVITFEDGTTITLSLQTEHYTGTEAIIYKGRNDTWGVI